MPHVSNDIALLSTRTSSTPFFTFRLPPSVGMAAGRQCRSQATREGALVGQGWRSGLAVAAGQAATAVAERRHKLQSESTSQLGAPGGEVGPWDMGDLEAFHDHFRCSEDMDLQGIQDSDSRGRMYTV